MTVGRQLAPRHRRLRMSCPARPARSTIKTDRYEPDQTDPTRSDNESGPSDRPEQMFLHEIRVIVPDQDPYTRQRPPSFFFFILFANLLLLQLWSLPPHLPHSTSQLLPDVVHGAVDRFSSLSVVPGTGASCSCCCCCCRR